MVNDQAQVARHMQVFSIRPAVIEELVQEGFVDAYFSLSGFRAEGAFAACLARIEEMVLLLATDQANRSCRAAATALSRPEFRACSTVSPSGLPS